jgi:hypothetical protein
LLPSWGYFVSLPSLEQRLKGNTSSSTEANSIMGEGHQHLGELDVAHSETIAKLKRHAKECDGAQAKHQPLKMEQQNAAKEARGFEENVVLPGHVKKSFLAKKQNS